MIPDQLANSGWSSDRWDQLETRARGVVEHHAHLRKAIPRGPDMLDAYVVELPRNASGNGHGLGMAVDEARVPTSIRVKFSLASNQLADPRLAERLVDRAARILSVAEDWALYHGDKAPSGSAHVDKAGKGLLGWSAANVSSANSAEHCVADGVLALQGSSSPYAAPYALASEPQFWRKLALPTPHQPRGLLPEVDALLGPGSRLVAVPGVPTPDEVEPGKRHGRAVLFAADPFALDVVVVEPPTLALDSYANGGLVLVLEERFLLRVVDPSALRRLDIT